MVILSAGLIFWMTILIGGLVTAVSVINDRLRER